MLFERDGFQFELHKNGSATLVKYRGGEAFPSVPAEADGHAVTAISGWAFGKFLGASAMIGVNLPSTLTRIGEYAFANCKALTSLNIPDGVADIGAAAFSGCSSLLKINLPQGIREVNDWLFKECRLLAGVKIPGGVLYVGKGAFFGCRALAEVFLPDGVESVEFETFRDCRSLTKIDLPPGLTRIGDGAFKGCNALTRLTVPERVAYIGWQEVFPSGTIILAAPGSYTEAYAKTKNLPFIPLEHAEDDEALAEKENYTFEPVAGWHVPVNRSMKEVLLAVLNAGGREAFEDARRFKSFVNDLLPGEGKNAGARGVLCAAVAQLKVAEAARQTDAAAKGRFAQALIDLGYQPRLAREAAVCFWSVLCYSSSE